MSKDLIIVSKDIYEEIAEFDPVKSKNYRMNKPYRTNIDLIFSILKKSKDKVEAYFKKNFPYYNSLTRLVRELQGNKFYVMHPALGLGVTGARNLIEVLRRHGLATVNETSLRAVVNNVNDPKRYFATTKSESNFLPIWVDSYAQPKSPSSKLFMGNIVYSPDGKWYVAINQKRLEKYLFGNTPNLTYREWMERLKELNSYSPLHSQHPRPVSELIEGLVAVPKSNPDMKVKADLAYIGNGKIFKPITKSEFEDVFTSYFDAMYSFAFKGIKPINELKLLDPEDAADPELNNRDPSNTAGKTTTQMSLFASSVSFD